MIKRAIIKKLLILISGLGFVFFCQNLYSHHSVSAIFNSDAPIEIEGVVTDFIFRNPHMLIRLNQTSPEGSTTEWLVEAAAATTYRRTGWDDQTLQAGDLIRVRGASTHDGSPMMTLSDIQRANTQTGPFAALFDEGTSVQNIRETLVPQERPLYLTDGTPNLSGLWQGRVSPYDPPRARGIEYNQAGLAHQESITPGYDPVLFCERPGLIRQASLTSYAVRIQQLADRIIFEYEEHGYSRTIYFDDRAALGVHSHFGDSVAEYEGDVLVIKTTNLLPNFVTPGGNLLSDQASVVERYWRADEAEYGAMLHLDSTISDPVYLSQDYVMTNIKVAVPEVEFLEVVCDRLEQEREEVNPYMSFFLTSEGTGDGANLGGLEGADAHCTALASEVGLGDKNWRAYLSTTLSATGETGINARDRIGSGPWYNANGELVALDSEHLHSENWLTGSTAVDERGLELTAIESTLRDDGFNSRHDILTGSDTGGRAVDSVSDTNCSNWTSNSKEGSAMVGHFDRTGGGDNPNSWNSAHASRGCGQENLQATNGDGLFYCFATAE